mgnify:CR=1 FL=1
MRGPWPISSVREPTPTIPSIGPAPPGSSAPPARTSFATRPTTAYIIIPPSELQAKGTYLRLVLSSALRYGLALPFAWLFWRLTRREAGPLKPPDLSWWPIVRLGVLGLMAFTLIYAFALDHMHPVTAAVFSATGFDLAAMIPLNEG